MVYPFMLLHPRNLQPYRVFFSNVSSANTFCYPIQISGVVEKQCVCSVFLKKYLTSLPILFFIYYPKLNLPLPASETLVASCLELIQNVLSQVSFFNRLYFEYKLVVSS